jgi:hypothetical protein
LQVHEVDIEYASSQSRSPSAVTCVDGTTMMTSAQDELERASKLISDIAEK